MPTEIGKETLSWGNIELEEKRDGFNQMGVYPVRHGWGDS
jgi:hypothetical protein